jgi:predicted glycosyltransferase
LDGTISLKFDKGPEEEMKILIDIGHPAHVHLFKNFAWAMQKNGHEIFFTVRDKESEIYLLSTYGFKYKSFGRHRKSKIGKIIGLIIFDVKMFETALLFKPDIFLSHGSVYAAQISWLLRKPHISMEDTGNMEQVRLYRPFTEVIFTPDTLNKRLGSKQIQLKTYHEIAYLNSLYFKKSPDVLELLKVKPKEQYCIIRLVAWEATHDSRKSGLSEKELNDIVNYLSPKMKIFITSEQKLNKNLLKFKLLLAPDVIHNVLAFSSLVISEGATLAAEAGFLGVPTIYINPKITCNNKELEEIGCVFTFKNGKGVLEKSKEIINNATLKNQIEFNSINLLNKKINLTTFMIWFIENYPKSFQIMKENPMYQDNFL